MTDFLFEMGLSNTCFSLALAILAMVVTARAHRPQLAHMLWVLVFIKLVTPPIVTISVGVPAAIASETNAAAVTTLQVDSPFDIATQSATGLATHTPSLLTHIRARLDSSKPIFAAIWLLGSLFMLAWSVQRVRRFSRLLAENTQPAPHQVQTAAATIARQLQLAKLPAILTTSAHLSPMVWWAGGRIRVVIPASLLEEMDVSQWRWVLAHELSHVRRRDYLVRWLEWLACVSFWWNPVVWWAHRSLRATEEICCDALVLSSLHPEPRCYAQSLLTAVEFLACPAIRPPAIASEINSGGSLERRFRMIISETPKRATSRWLQACVLLCAAVVLPLGMVYAQDYEAVGKRLKAAVQAGELTGQQARMMFGALKKAGSPKDNQPADQAQAYLMKVKQELGAAMEAGKISKEDAVKRFEAAEQAIKKKMAAGDKKHDAKQITREDFANATTKIRQAIADGKISEEEGRAKLIAMRKMLGAQMKGSDKKDGDKKDGDRKFTRKDYHDAEAKLKELVAAGKMTEEAAKKRLNGLRKRIAAQAKDGDQKNARERVERIGREIRQAVADGKITKEEARAKMQAVRKQNAAKNKDGEQKGASDMERIGREIRQAVVDGKITKEQARAKMEIVRKKLGQQGEQAPKREINWENIKKRIEGAVERGDMTRDEADAKYKEIRKRVAGDRQR